MEQEYKWKLTSPAQGETAAESELVRGCTLDRQTFDMRAVYYDTADGLLTAHHSALRLRQENDVSVCCMKLPVAEGGACTLRQEYEVKAATVDQGLALLPEKGADPKLCRQVRQAGVVELCRVEYLRQAWELEVKAEGKTCRGELTLDQGQALRQDRTAPILEMEFELKEGDEALFHAFAAKLAQDFGLEPEPRSKFARAMAL